jgi:hypothetical protein
MNHVSPMARLEEVEVSQLAEVTGGAMIWVGDGYCGTPFPWPRPPLSVTNSLVSVVNPAVAQQFGMRQG